MDKATVSVTNEQYIALLDKVEELTKEIDKATGKMNHYKNKYYKLKRILGKQKKKKKQHYRNGQKKGARGRNG